MPNHYGVQAPACPYCNARITIHQTYIPGHCGGHDCRHKHAVAAGKLRDEARHAADQQRRDGATREVNLVRGVIAAALDADPDAVQIAILPHQNVPVAPLPDPVRAEFLDYLKQTIAAARASVMQSPFIGPPAPQALRDPDPIEIAGCTACQGNCCRDGRQSHAFLTKSCMEEIVAAKPQLGDAELLAYYAAAIPAESVTGSCVYQTATGCVLPRDWRSDTCNTFRCSPLRQLAQIAPPGEDVPVALAAAQGESFKLLAHRDSRGTVPIPLAATTG